VAIYQLGDAVPRIHPTAWVADNASVIGRVELCEGANIWYGVTVRGDNDWMLIGKNSNIQDGSMLHTDAGVPFVIGEGVTVGHQVMLHGCTVGDNTLIGIQSVLLNHCRIGKDSIVGAGSLVTEGKEFPDGALIVGRPAKVVRMLTAEEIERLQGMAAHYVANAQRHRTELQRIA
jgi:carbonic anhydrase/acetyltransferase-like protein (isoleucine patch superfamily)